MAAPLKVHPSDLETGSQDAALLSRGSVRSDYGHKAAPPLPPRSCPPRKRHSCCRCCCWTICLVISFFVVLAATAAILYAVFQPKTPDYSVDRLRITSFKVNNVDAANFNVRTAFSVEVTAVNPNKKIGIFYEKNSHLSIWYGGSNLCSGSLPAFYQGHRNTTVITVALTGETVVPAAVEASLIAQQAAGGIPLIFRGSVPVRVKFGALKLWTVRFLVTCDLTVNALREGSNVSIQTKTCRFRFRLRN